MGFFKKTDKIAAFFKTSKQYLYRKGEVILRSGDVPSGVYYLEEGFVKVYSIRLDGTEDLHLIHKPGEILSGLWIFGYKVRNVTLEAITPAILRRKTKDEVITLLDSDHDAMREALKILVTTTYIMHNRIINLEITNSYPRIMKRLLILSRRFGERNGQRVTLKVPLTHANIANSINMSRETASRELEQLKRKKIISEKNHIITIEDIGELKSELTTYYENK